MYEEKTFVDFDEFWHIHKFDQVIKNGLLFVSKISVEGGKRGVKVCMGINST